MIRTFFARPGAGKTTECVALAKKNARHYDHVFLNFKNTVPGVHSCDLDGLGQWTFPKKSYIAIDEAGIDFNSRKTKSLPQHTIKWFKLHRHYRCDLDVFSQSWDDMDITIRRLSSELWLLYRLGPWTLGRRIYKRVGVDKMTHQIIDEYRMASMLWLFIWPLQLGYPFQKKFTLTFRPFYYKFFDSWECDDLPVRPFPVLNQKKKRRIIWRSLIRKRKRSSSEVLDTSDDSAAV